MNKRSLVRISALSLCLLAAGAAAQAGDTKPASAAGATTQKPSPLFGRFTLAATAGEKEVRQKAVDLAVSEVFFALRSVGRKRIEAKTRMPAWVDIKQTGAKITFHLEGRAPEPCPLEGSQKGKDPDGNEAQFAARWDGTSLVQTVTTEEGKRTNVFKPQPDGGLKLSVELRSERFKTPIRYTLTYKAAQK